MACRLLCKKLKRHFKFSNFKFKIFSAKSISSTAKMNVKIPPNTMDPSVENIIQIDEDQMCNENLVVVRADEDNGGSGCPCDASFNVTPDSRSGGGSSRGPSMPTGVQQNASARMYRDPYAVSLDDSNPSSYFDSFQDSYDYLNRRGFPYGSFERGAARGGTSMRASTPVPCGSPGRYAAFERSVIAPTTAHYASTPRDMLRGAQLHLTNPSYLGADKYNVSGRSADGTFDQAYVNTSGRSSCPNSSR